MNSIYILSEDNHGPICYGATKADCVRYAIENHWIEGDDEVNLCGLVEFAGHRVHFSNKQWGRLDEYFGENWFEVLFDATEAQFNDLFEDQFILWEQEITDYGR